MLSFLSVFPSLFDNLKIFHLSFDILLLNQMYVMIEQSGCFFTYNVNRVYNLEFYFGVLNLLICVKSLECTAFFSLLLNCVIKNNSDYYFGCGLYIFFTTLLIGSYVCCNTTNTIKYRTIAYIVFVYSQIFTVLVQIPEK